MPFNKSFNEMHFPLSLKKLILLKFAIASTTNVTVEHALRYTQTCAIA